LLVLKHTKQSLNKRSYKLEMKKALIAFGMLLMAAPAHADLTHKISSSVQLTVDSAASQATRLGSTYSVTGNNLTVTTEGGLGTLTSGSAVGYTPTSYTAPSTGTYSLTESFIEGDVIPTGTTVSSGVVGTLPAFGSVTTTAGGVAGSLAGTIDSTHTIGLTAGGAGTSATGQFITEITVK
jgi:hypothetical protein